MVTVPPILPQPFPKSLTPKFGLYSWTIGAGGIPTAHAQGSCGAGD